MDLQASNNRNRLALAAAFSLMLPAAIAMGGEATTSASAGSNPVGPGTATATAGYNGNGPGFANTRTHSGRVSFGRGVAFGIDQNGVSFSASHAVAGQRGPAVASNFNMTVGFDGSVSRSHGVSVAQGGQARTAHAGGSTGHNGVTPTAVSTAGGQTHRGGTVRATTQADTKPSVRGIARGNPFQNRRALARAAQAKKFKKIRMQRRGYWKRR